MKKTLKFLKKHWMNILSAFVVLVSVSYGLFFGTVIINGSSMEPNFTSGDVTIIRTDNKNIEAGDIVTVSGEALTEAKGGHFDNMIKRVVGMPGQKVSIIDGIVYVDDVEFSEDYIRGDMDNSQNIEIQLGDDEFFIMGDNRNYSSDSRHYGPVTRDMIKGYTLFNIRNAK